MVSIKEIGTSIVAFLRKLVVCIPPAAQKATAVADQAAATIESVASKVEKQQN